MITHRLISGPPLAASVAGWLPEGRRTALENRTRRRAGVL